MPSIPWFVWAFGSVLIWGVHYNLISKASQAVSPIFLFLLPVPFLVIALPLYYHILVNDWQTLMSSSTVIKVCTGICAVTGTAGTLMLFRAMGTAPSPTHVGFIEIMYPLFVALFGYLLFKEQQLTWSMGLGGTMMLIGAGLIIYNH